MSFRESSPDMQMKLTGFYYQLPNDKRRMMDESKEAAFHRDVVARIDEDIFRSLYCQDNGAPNKPIRQMVGAITLMHYHNWSTSGLFDQIHFNLLTMRALGIVDYDETPFCRATYFNFLGRLAEHYVKTGENLLEQVFDHLTARQMKELGIKGNIQRTDSFQALSNIVSYSRLRLLVEVLIRLWRVLTEGDKEQFAEIFEPYVREDAGHYVHKLRQSDMQGELEELGRTYMRLHDSLQGKYSDVKAFRNFQRTLGDQFVRSGERVQVREARDIGSDSLQSPDDPEATYRNKNGKKSRGQVVSVTETVSPKKSVNLVTDVVVAPNNKDDAAIHKDRIAKIKEKTPELEENHTDGAYGSEDVDKEMEEHEVRHVVTGIRGRRGEVEINIEESKETYCVSCPGQSVAATKTRKRWKASFDLSICRACSVSESCPTQQLKSCRAFYFTHEDFLARRRWKSLREIPEERRKLRPNVEATVKEFSRAFNHKGKLPYRGRFRTEVYAFCTAVGINFGRVVRYRERKVRENEAGASNPCPAPARSCRRVLEFTFCLTKKLAGGVREYLRAVFPLGDKRLAAA